MRFRLRPAVAAVALTLGAMVQFAVLSPSVAAFGGGKNNGLVGTRGGNMIKTLTASAFHSLALKSDGTVWAWGWNGYGQLGDGTTTSRYTPVQVSGLTGVVAIAAGYYHSLALKSDGTVWAWGRNVYGQLGDGTTTSRYTPVQTLNLNLAPTHPNKAGTATVTATSLTATWPDGVGTYKYYPVLTRPSDGAWLQYPGWQWMRTVTFSGLTPNTPYHVWVKYGSHDGAESSFGSGAVVVNKYTLANPPSGVSLSNPTQTSLTVSWSANGNPAGTVYEVSLDNGSGTRLAGPYTTTTTSYAFTGLTPGTAYRGVVRARNNEGVWTAYAYSTGTVRTIPATPTLTGTTGGLGWSRAGRGYVVLTWQPVQGATGYKVWVFDGHAYRAFDVGNTTTWDSRVARIYPSEATLDQYGDNTVTTDLFNHVQGGLDLRDRPTKLYQKTAGTTYDSYTNYWFRVSAYNESGESPKSNAYTPTLPDQTDSVAPSIASVVINGGDTSTTVSNVQVQVNASDDKSGIAYLLMSNDATAWTQVAYANPISWSLPPGTGTRTVYVKAVDRAGNVSAVASASIYEDFQALPPGPSNTLTGTNTSVTSTTGTAGTLNGVPVRFVDSPTVTLNLTTSGVAGVRVSFDGANWSSWMSPSATQDITLLGGDAKIRKVYVQYMDPYGKLSPTHSLAFTVDTQAPTIQASWLGGATVTNAGSATLVLNATDNISPQSALQVSLDGGATWRPYATLIPVTFSGSGYKTLTVLVKDQAGNISSTVVGIFQ